jgi:pyruvate dehydrogenase E1 component
LRFPDRQARRSRRHFHADGFGKILDAIAKTDGARRRIVTTSPDVTVSTNLGTWVNRRGLFAKPRWPTSSRRSASRARRSGSSRRRPAYRTGHCRDEPVPLLGAAGLSHSLFGERLMPIGTLYDPFISRGLDALNYACYQDARFLRRGDALRRVAAPEGGAHQSIGTPLIGMAQDGLASFEPAFADELAVIIDWGFDYMQRDGRAIGPISPTGRATSRAARSTCGFPPAQIEQPPRQVTPALASDIIRGAYWLVPPTPSAR